MIDYQIHYLLYPYRSESSRERLYCLCNELTTPIQSIKIWNKLLELRMQDWETIPQPILSLQENLTYAGQQLSAIKGKMLPDNRGEQAIDYDEQLRLLRSQFVEPINIILSNVERLPTLRTDLEAIYPDASQFTEGVTRAIHHIWAAVDVLTNPDLQLPPYVMGWIDTRDEIRTKAKNKDTSVLEELHQALQNPISDIRCEAAESLRYVKDSRSVPFLISLLDDDNPKVRAEVAETLGVLGDKRAVEPLIKSLLKYRDMRWGPSGALGKLGEKSAVDALEQALEEEMGNSNTPVDISRTVISMEQALAAIGSPEAKKVLVRFWPQKYL